ncbi:uncharacterized protein [Anabrus simplex]|uniref:uncharacterized protein n=1 Tax=Anabrus simplex TaxID=316456 RepID=UPI0035A3160A
MRRFTYVDNIIVMAVFLIVIATKNLHVEGACLGSLCANFTGIEERIENGIEEIGEEIEEAAAAVKSKGEELFLDLKNYFRGDNGNCVCIDYNCGCCAHLEEPIIELNSTICANASYLVKDYGISLTVTVNQYTIFNETVSVRNPPPVCLGVPYVKEWAEACVHLHDIDATTSHLHACVAVEARMKRIVIAKYELGCFDIGPRQFINNELDDNSLHQYPSVLMV